MLAGHTTGGVEQYGLVNLNLVFRGDSLVVRLVFPGILVVVVSLDSSASFERPRIEDQTIVAVLHSEMKPYATGRIGAGQLVTGEIDDGDLRVESPVCDIDAIDGNPSRL